MWPLKWQWRYLSAFTLGLTITTTGCWSTRPFAGTSLPYERDLDALSIVEPGGVTTNMFGEAAALLPLPLLLDSIK